MTAGTSSLDGGQAWAAIEREADALGDAFSDRVRDEVGRFLDTEKALAAPPALSAIADDNVSWLCGVVPGVRILREIGRGGMGVVYEGMEEATGRHVAVKLLHADRRTPGLVRRLRREAEALARIEHPGVTRLYSTGVCAAPLAGSPYIVMELVRGETPTMYAESRSLSVRDRAALAMRIAEAVGAAHSNGVLHLDLKPGNVLVREDGSVKVLDFGISKVLDGGDACATMTFMTHPFGSVASMAPEQFEGRAGSAASDVYALGCLMFRLLTGRSAHDVEGVPLSEASKRVTHAPAPSVRRFNRAASPDLDVVVRTALAADPRDRYPDAGALASDLARVLRGEPIAARRPGAWRRVRAFAARRPALMASTVAATLALLLGAVAATTQAVRATRAEVRALERYEDVRALANSVIFELHDAIEDLPGATQARITLLDRAMQFLDTLARDPDADSELRLELVEAYIKIARALGDTQLSSVGDAAGWIRSANAAAALLDRLLIERPDDPRVQLVAIRVRLMQYEHRAVRTFTTPFDPEESREPFEERLNALLSFSAALEDMLATRPDDLEALRLLAYIVWHRGRHYMSWHEGELAVQAVADAVDLYEALLRHTPNDYRIRWETARAIHILGYYRSLSGGDGAPEQREARRRLRALLDERPWSISARHVLTSVNGRLALDLAAAGDHEGALEAMEESLSLARELTAQDPQSVIMFRGYSVMQSWLANVLEHGALDERRPLEDRIASASASLAARDAAIALLNERITRGWLFQYESHYPELQRIDRERVVALLHSLETLANTAGSPGVDL